MNNGFGLDYVEHPPNNTTVLEQTHYYKAVICLVAELPVRAAVVKD